MEERVTLAATLEHTSKYTQSLETRLQPLPIEVRTGVVLAVQELLVNIVKHAYAGEEGMIDFTLTVSDSVLTVAVVDQGKNAYQLPEEVAEPDMLALPEGGLGLFIMHQTFDDITYTRVAESNHWHLKKRLETQP
ncbi:MAG: hypothetical protein OHK0046_00550 [Anaerolineae bacterium]